MGRYLHIPFLALALASAGPIAAEEFKYYVWVDEQGIVHAAEEAPKGRDYQVRVIENINANVVPPEDFRPYSSELPDQTAGPPAQPGSVQPPAGGAGRGASDTQSAGTGRR